MKPKPSPLPLGFKAHAERLSVSIRSKLGYKLTDACPARVVAEHFGVKVFSIYDLNTLLLSGTLDEFKDVNAVVAQLTTLVTDSERPFSAMAMGVCGFKIIIYNPNSSLARQESDIMHEMGHHICNHAGNCFGGSLDFALRTHDDCSEAEAEWLGWSLQVPESGLLTLVKAGHSNEEIAANYGASIQVVNVRRSRLAIDKRVAASESRRTRTNS